MLSLLVLCAVYTPTHPATLGTAYCNWSRQFGGTISRVQHPAKLAGQLAVRSTGGLAEKDVTVWSMMINV